MLMQAEFDGVCAEHEGDPITLHDPIRVFLR
jgi:hypothetical protein